MKRNNKKGFTIVELVIVIAVIAILSAVLIPTFGNVIDEANKTAAQQEARNGYTKCYAADLADGVINGTEVTDTKYTVTGGVASYEVTKGNWKATFNGSTMTVAEVE